MTRLESCPFCGGEQGPEPSLRWLKKRGENCFVWCTTCGSAGPTGNQTEAEAIAAWNTRATPTPSPDADAVVKLKGALARIADAWVAWVANNSEGDDYDEGYEDGLKYCHEIARVALATALEIELKP